MNRNRISKRNSGAIVLFFAVFLLMGSLSFFTIQSKSVVRLLSRQRKALVESRKKDLPERVGRFSAREVILKK